MGSGARSAFESEANGRIGAAVIRSGSLMVRGCGAARANTSPPVQTYLPATNFKTDAVAQVCDAGQEFSGGGGFQSDIDMRELARAFLRALMLRLFGMKRHYGDLSPDIESVEESVHSRLPDRGPSPYAREAIRTYLEIAAMS